MSARDPFLFYDIAEYLEMRDIKELSKVSSNTMNTCLSKIGKRMRNELYSTHLEVIVLILCKEYKNGKKSCTIEGIYDNTEVFKKVYNYLDAYEILYYHYEDEIEDEIDDIYLSAMVVKLGDIIYVEDIVDELRSNIIVSGKDLYENKLGVHREFPGSILDMINDFTNYTLIPNIVSPFIYIHVSKYNNERNERIQFLPSDYLELFNDLNQSVTDYIIFLNQLPDIMSDWEFEEMSNLYDRLDI